MDPALAQTLFGMMVQIRVVEERIVDLYPEQEMRCPVHLCIGQEAVSAGVCAALEKEDYVLSGHRSHGHYLAKGGDLKRMMAEIYGKATGCAQGKGGSMHLVDLDVGFLGAAPIVGSTIPIAVGAAFSAQMRGDHRVTAVFFGDGATETGVFHESVNFASLKKLPIIFVCESNLYSVYSPMSVRQPEGREIAGLARAHGIESHQGDGNDPLAVHALAEAAVEKARAGDGPVFLEFATYRWREHCGPEYDNDIGYRSEAEFLTWKERYPITNFGKRLIDDGVIDAAGQDTIHERCREDMQKAVAFAKQSPFPDVETLHDDVTASSTNAWVAAQ